MLHLLLLLTTQPSKSKSAINPSILLHLHSCSSPLLLHLHFCSSPLLLHLHFCSSPLPLHLHSCSSLLLLHLHSCSSPPLLLHLQITTAVVSSAAHHRCCSICSSPPLLLHPQLTTAAVPSASISAAAAPQLQLHCNFSGCTTCILSI
jgi:hypothetical protein